MLSQSLPWLDAGFVQNVLRSSETDNSIEVKDVTMQYATATGDNYWSDMIRANVTYSRNNSVCMTIEKKTIIIKIAPSTGAKKDFLSELGVFDTEIKMMETTLVKMNEILEDEGYRLSPRTLFTKNKDPPLIVMEDLAPLGFRMADRQVGLDLEHSIIAMRALARFHASSVAVWEKNPKAISTYDRNILQSGNDKISRSLPNMIMTVAEELLNWPELGPSRHSYSEKVAKLSHNCVERYTAFITPKANEFNVLNHGDCWTNNMLFRYNDERKVIDHIFVDFQLCILSSPAVDILNFSNTSISEDVELHHVDALLEEYLNVLAKSMAKLRCNGKAPDMAELKRILLKYQFLAVITSCVALPFMLVDKSEAKTIDEMAQEGEHYIHPGYKELAYRKKMLMRLPKWNASGALDI